MTRGAGALAAGGAVNPRLKSLAVTAGLSFWFYVFASAAGVLEPWHLLAFASAVLAATQAFASRVSRGLDIVAVANTAVFLGLLFATLISLYGLLFRALRVDLLRARGARGGEGGGTYWLPLHGGAHDTVRQY